MVCIGTLFARGEPSVVVVRENVEESRWLTLFFLAGLFLASAADDSKLLLSRSSLSIRRLRGVWEVSVPSGGPVCALEALAEGFFSSFTAFLASRGCLMLYMNIPVTMRKNATI